MQRHASVVIFGGTSEGRELAEYAEAHHIPVLVSVVSGYGESLLRESDLVQVHTGALDEAAMRQFLLEAAPKLVLDATIFSLRKEETNKAAAEACNPPRKIVLTEESSNNAASPLVLG